MDGDRDFAAVYALPAGDLGLCNAGNIVGVHLAGLCRGGIERAFGHAANSRRLQQKTGKLLMPVGLL